MTLEGGQANLSPHNTEHFYQLKERKMNVKKTLKRMLTSLLTLSMLLSLCSGALAAEDTVETKDLEEVTISVDYQQSAQIPLDGWYRKTLSDDRQIQMYFSEYAACRAYFTVVAVPDGVEDAQVWAAEQGYVALMEARGEVLVLLLPSASGWGELEKELSYVTEAMTFVNAGKNEDGTLMFTNYSTFYLVGYGKGAAALEAWAAENPILVGSQAYIDATGAGAEYLSEVGAKSYDGTNTGGYDPGIADVDEFKAVLASHGYADELITRSDVPVPTYFVGETDDDSVAYWKSANDCVEEAVDGVYWQAKDSDAFQTEYANACTAEGHGIAQVKVSNDADCAALAEFLYSYTRYNVPFAYSNHLSERMDYTAVRVAAQAAAQSADYLTDMQRVAYAEPVTSDSGVVYDSYYVLARVQGEVGNGVVESGIIAFSDDNGDSRLDAREYLMYIPESATSDAPVVFQFPGMTQSVAVGFDSTQWWRVADDEGVIVVIVGEAYNNGVALRWKNSDMAYRAIRDILEKDGTLSAKIDWTRVYGSGHSLGSQQVQNFVHNHPEFFAAVGSTSFGSAVSDGTGEAVPTMLVTGQSDLPFLMDDLWTSSSLKTWFSYLAAANNLKVDEATADNADIRIEGEARTWLYTWNNEQDIPMVVWGQTYLREHNCYPAEIPATWDFISRYTMDTDGNRYYTNTDGDTQRIESDSAVPTATPIEESTAADKTVGAYQTRNGYFTYQISVGESTREIEIYIPDGARQREYWVSIALPNNTNSAEFLSTAGWFDIADETLACLLIMKPEEGTWDSVEEELPYVNAAMNTLASSGKYYSAFTYDYLVGYAEGAPALQLWAAQNPLKMISQVYLNAQSDEDYQKLLQSAGETQVGETPQPNHMDFVGDSRKGAYTDKDGNAVTQKRTFAAQYYSDIPIPTWFVGDSSQSLIDYWMEVNDCFAAAQTDGVYGQVYWQDKENSDAIATSFSDIRTQVAVKADKDLALDDADLTQNIYDFLTYYSGYDNNSVYGHFITERLQYANKDTENVLYRDHMWQGINRTYIIYIPDSVKESGEAPLVVATHGAGQTAMVFMEATDIKEAADQYGFIAVTYDLTGNADYMVDLLELVKQDCEAVGVSVDENRIYAYGQSAGGGAVANTLAQSEKTVDLFAAFGITSGVRSAAQENGSDKIVPFYAIYGEYDYWPMKLGELASGDWTGSQRTQYAWSADTQTYWADRLLGMTLMELVDPDSYELIDGISDSLVPENTPISLIVNPTETANRYKSYVWSIEAEQDEVPIFVWSQCYGRGHNLVPSDLNQLWENWFSKWEKGEEPDSLLYWSDGVGEGTAKKVYQVPAQEISPVTPNPNPGKPSTGNSSADDNTATELESKTFRDVHGVNHWSVNAVDFVVARGLFNGTSETLFSPDTAMSRGMLAMVLYRLEGEPAASAASGRFTDVAKDSYYDKAIGWAVENGILSGYGDGRMGPDDPVTREQLATMLWRYSKSPAASASLAKFSDAAQVSDYAATAMSWAVQNGIVNGRGNGILAPNGQATRAEVAQMMMNFLQYTGK